VTTVRRHEFAAALGWIGSSKWMEISTAGDDVRLRSGDPTRSQSTTLPDDDEDAIEPSVVSAGVLAAVVGTLRGDSVRLARSGQRLRIDCSETRAEIPIVDDPEPAEMPRAETAVDRFAVVDSDSFLAGLTAVAGAMGRNTSVPSRMGVVISSTSSGLRLESTDNYSAALADLGCRWRTESGEISPHRPQRVAISPASVLAVRRMAAALDAYSGEDDVEIGLGSDRTVSVERGRRRLSMATHTTSIPDLAEFLADDPDADRCQSSPSDLIHAIRAARFTGVDRVMLEMRPTSISVSSAGESGSGETIIGADWSGEACRIDFHRSVLESALRPHAGSDYVRFTVGAARRIIFQSAEAEGIRTAAARLSIVSASAAA